MPQQEPQPYLSNSGWVINGKHVALVKKALLQRARETGNWDGTASGEPAIIVSLGPKPTFAAFLRTARALQEMGLCFVFVKEGGEAKGTLHGKKQMEVAGLRLCGHGVDL